MPPDLHPSLSPGPIPKPICVGCSATDKEAALAAIRDSKTLFLCLTCAGAVWFDAHVELGRQAMAAATAAIAPEIAS